MHTKELQERALVIREKYREVELAKYGRSWTSEEHALGFIGDAGDLMKLVIAKNGVRDIPDLDAKLRHELADCLWSVLILAHEFDVDLEASFMDTMAMLEHKVQGKLEAL